MNRRELLRILGASATIPLLPTGAKALEHLHGRAAAQLGFRTIHGQQQRVLMRLVDQIIPRTATPGAVDVHVPQLIDLLLTEWYEPTDTARFLANLDDIDLQARATRGARFVALPLRSLHQLLRDLESQKSVASGAPRAFRDVKSLTVWGYFTSERVSKEVLKERMFFSAYEGNARVEGQR